MLATCAQPDDDPPMNDASLSDALSADIEATIVAPVTQWFYKRCFLLAGGFAAIGLYFCYAALVGYPSQNRNVASYDAPQPHTDGDLAAQKRIAVVLGVCALLTLLWARVHRGRAWRMRDGKVQTPWNTKFAAKSVTDIDRRRWHRGVALLISHDSDRFLKLKLDDYKYRDTARIIRAIAAHHPQVRIDPPIVNPELSREVTQR